MTIRPRNGMDGGIDALAMQRNGNIVAAGYSATQSSWNQTLALARFKGGNDCVVPKVVGKLVGAARLALRKANCKAGTVRERLSSAIGINRVIAQSRKRGKRLPGGSSVNLVVSKGKRR
jgi:beta-lactam-binding protein with PASTA domain